MVNENFASSIKNNTESIGFLNLYFAKVQSFNDNLYPIDRQKEIDSVNNPNLKAQKQTSWKLLEFAVKDIFNKKTEDFTFKCENGKWQTDGFYFSISHTKKLVCLALSDAPVGVDIENITDFASRVENRKGFFEKIAAKKELEIIKSPSIGRLLQLWTGKESNFKRNNQKVFLPRSTEVDVNETFYAFLAEDGEGFKVSALYGFGALDNCLQCSAEGYLTAICSKFKDCKIYGLDLVNNKKVRLCKQ